MKINIAGGSGVMGRVHKPIFEKYGHEVLISGRNSIPSLEEAAAQSDLTIVSVPISATEETIKRVAPYCSAIMDLTGIKVRPMYWMMKYSRSNAEVGGLHPLYGNVSSINGKTVIYCPTSRSGEKCREVLRCFRMEGAKIKEMQPETHDLRVTGLAQNARTFLFQAYANLLHDNGVDIKELYEISPPPTRILLDLIARQYSPANDQLYKDMEADLELSPSIRKQLSDFLDNTRTASSNEAIRQMFGAELGPAQERAKKLIEGK